MSIYNLNYIQKVVELLPPDKRGPKMVNWLIDLLGPMGVNYNDLFVDYKTGSDYDLYDSLTTYNTGDRVQYSQSVYESIIDNNTLNPTDVAGWRLYEEYFIGVDERIKYSHIKVVLEYALNRRFNTTFRQPNLISDIYIESNQPPYGPFIVGAIEDESSVVYFDTSSDWVINGYSFATFNNFTVYVPLAVFEAQSADVNAREPIFRYFIDKYNSAGLNYNIVTY